MTRCFYSKVLYAKPSEISISTERPNSSTSIKKTPHSFVRVSEQFIKSVEKMESVVLVPMKLLDIPIVSENSVSVSPIIIPEITASGHSNLYEVFQLVKKFKDKLLGINSAIGQEEDLGAIMPDSSLEVDDTIYSFRPSPIPSNRSQSNLVVNSGNGAMDNNASASMACMHGHDSGIWSSSSFVEASGSIESVSLPPVASDSSVGCGSKHMNGNGGVGSCSTCSSLTSSSSSSEVSDMDFESGLQFLPSSNCNLASPGSSRGGMTNIIQASCVVRKSLHSAKSLCAFLIDLIAVTQFIQDRYLEELMVGYSE